MIGIGGSATVDGGVGCLQALDAEFLDKDGNPIPFGGGNLIQLHTVDLSVMQERLEGIRLEVLCDVDNPLLGKNGAAKIFAPQKGADEQGVLTLDHNLTHYAQIVQRDCGISLADLPHSGAAGGLSAV